MNMQVHTGQRLHQRLLGTLLWEAKKRRMCLSQPSLAIEKERDWLRSERGIKIEIWTGLMFLPPQRTEIETKRGTDISETVRTGAESVTDMAIGWTEATVYPGSARPVEKGTTKSDQ